MNRPNSRRRILIFAAVLMIFSLGCLCMPLGILSTPTIPPTQIQPPPVSPVAPQPSQTASLPPTPAPTETSQSIPGNSLDPVGPWLLIESYQGLWAVNPDGTGMTQLTETDFWHGQMSRTIQPGANQVAYVSPADFSFKHMALNLLSLPEGKSTLVSNLTSPATEAYSASGPGDPGFEALRAIGEQPSLAWSPDGKKLAFVGAMDGPSADLYIYTGVPGQAVRVSSDAGQDFSPSWSPDGKHLLYLEADGFGTGAGMSMAGVWVANGDGSGATRLYSTSSAGEEVRGWLDDTTVLLDTWSVVCGSGNLRLYDVVTRVETVLAKGCIASASAAGSHGAAMYSDETGTYLLTADARTPVKVSDEKNARIKPWGPDDQIFTVRFEDESLASFGTSQPNEFDHQVSPITAPPDASMLRSDQTDVAIYGAIWGWTSRIPAQQGAWITGPGIEIGRIYDGAARFPAWSAHNNFIFFAPLEGGYDMYLTTFDSYYSDLHVVNHLDADILSVNWIGPPAY